MRTEVTRREYARAGQRYASDLTEAEWALIEPSMPATKPFGPPARDRLARRAGRYPLYRADGLSVTNAAEGLAAVHNRASYF
jgi:transposase